MHKSWLPLLLIVSWIAPLRGAEPVVPELARDVFTAYVRKSSPLSAPKPGRITRASAQ